MTRHQSISCDRCGQVGKTDNQYQKGWYHIQLYTIVNNLPKDAGGYDLCFSCKGIWETYLSGKKGPE